MASCERDIWALVAQIEPTLSQKNGAIASHNNLRDVLAQGTFGRRVKGSYLSGSYARDTAVRPIDDVDIVFLIDPSAAWSTSSLLYLSSRPSPERVLESFANAIRYRYPESSVRTQRRSVRLQLHHLDIDVVPAIEVDPKVILIPDADEGGWIKSAPRVHIEIAAQTNQARQGRFKPLVKLLKFWNNNLPSTANLRSFAIETIATRLFRKEPIASLEDGLYRTLDFIAFCGGKDGCHFKWGEKCGVKLGWFATEIPDVGLGSNLAKGVEEDRRTKLINAAVRSRDKMYEARQAVRPETALSRVLEALRA